MPQRHEPEDTILEQTRTIAVVGLSADESRDSYRVARYMQDQGYRIIPVNPRESGLILGQPVRATLADVAEPVDAVDVFRRSDRTDEVIDAAITVGAKAIWLQLGITNPAGLQRARAAGLLATEDRCIMVDHRRWLAAQRA